MSDPDFSDLGEPEASLAAGIYDLESPDDEESPGLPESVKATMTEDQIAEKEAEIAEQSEKGKKQIEDRARGMAELISAFVNAVVDPDSTPS